MGICLAEAMTVGLPAVGYRSCHAVNEIIRDKGNGFLCEDGVEPFAEALRRLMSDEGLRKRWGTRQGVQRKHMRLQKFGENGGYCLKKRHLEGERRIRLWNP